MPQPSAMQTVGRDGSPSAAAKTELATLLSIACFGWGMTF